LRHHSTLYVLAGAPGEAIILRFAVGSNGLLFGEALHVGAEQRMCTVVIGSSAAKRSAEFTFPSSPLSATRGEEPDPDRRADLPPDYTRGFVVPMQAFLSLAERGRVNLEVAFF